MQQRSTQAIILSRTNFGEADRIITFLTPDQGKISGLVKGVRKSKSKLAGGIELFSVSDITFIPGRGETSTIISTRLVRHYGNIVKNLERTNAGYELIKLLNKSTEDNPESEYFHLLDEAFAALDDQTISLPLIYVWFCSQLLKLAGHAPNLKTDLEGYRLEAEKKYDFNFDAMSFQPSRAGSSSFGADQIKVLRLLFAGGRPTQLAQVQDIESIAVQLQILIKPMLQAQSIAII